MRKLKVGIDDFKELRDEGGYFVDKSLLIREVIEGSKCLLLPRPRRFGKTLNLSMLRYFFEKSDGDRRDLFDGLHITEDVGAMEHQGRYPVIFMSLKNIKGGDWTVAQDAIVEKIATLYKRHRYVADGLAEDDRDQFERLATGKGGRADLNSSLANLITHLHSYHESPVVVLIDDYDTPILRAWDHGYYGEMTEFMRDWLGAGLKHENGLALYRAVVTGILRVATASIFSGFNNLVTWPPLRGGPFTDKFGFTQPEVDQLLSDFGVPELADPINEWYNGYDFGGRRSTIPGRWSVACSRVPPPSARTGSTPPPIRSFTKSLRQEG